MKGGFFIKKIIIACFLVISCLSLNKKSNEEVIIPNDSIRLRIVSNSNNSSDISLKLKIKKVIEDYLYDKVSSASNVQEAGNIVENNKENINNLIKNNLNSNDFKVEYGLNYFPSKVYKGVIYNGGYYNSLVITLGTGSGNNWWCVLFPPLCLIEDNNTTEDVEYKFFIKRIIDKYL